MEKKCAAFNQTLASVCNGYIAECDEQLLPGVALVNLNAAGGMHSLCLSSRRQHNTVSFQRSGNKAD